MNVTPSALAAMFLGFSTLFNGALRSAQPQTQRFSMSVPSGGEQNVYSFMAQILRFRKWLGERVIQNIASHSYTLANATYENTVSVEREKIEDDAYGIYNPLVSELGRTASLWMDDLTVSAMRNGDSTTLAEAKTFDGVPFFSGAHPIDPNNAALGTQSNLFSSATSGLCALTAANYDKVRTAMVGFVGQDGGPLNIIPDLLVVPPQLERTARTIIEADTIPGDAATGGTGAAVTNVLKGSAKVLVLPQLAADATTWYLMDTSKAIKPFIQQLRRAPQFVSMDNPNDAPVFMRKMFVYGADARGAAGYGLWFLACKAVG